ncbi:SusD/RagB family nutrient-binding outer membrane lipoprotein [Pontibacter chitinilyticus]|uniref:SusD/RagB family nutrient-binding outer membrane lipoprotein n=1 Tax=Pontibacter chitinilyticus TaxID=2674989 RepID=UPI00321A9F8C
MKKNKYLILFLLLFSTTFYSCDKDYFDINRDPNSPAEVSEDLLLTATLANFSYEVVGGYPPRVTNLWTKHLADATPPPHVGTYDIDENDVNNFWTYTSYTHVMNNSKKLSELALANENPQYSAIAKIVWAWNMTYITDLFGDVPFSQAWKGEEGNFKPTYDSQEDVYKAIQNLLDEAIVEANQPAGLKVPGADDLVYGGKMANWIKLANSLKARAYLRLSYAPGYDAAEQADKALAALNAGAISSNAEMPTFKYANQPGAENPWYQYAIDGKWGTFTRPSVFYLDLLQSKNDPRIAYQATVATTGTDIGKYVGATNDGGNPGTAGSAIGPFYSAADAPVYMFIYAEIPFIRAEAEFLKAGKMITPEVIDAYNKGIQASMSMYGISAAEITAYQLANALNVLDPEAAYDQIMTQKYIANYLQVEPYNDYRRTGYPVLPLNEEAVIDRIPLRFPVPSGERLYNPTNVPSNLPAGYASLLVPVWWDTTL